MLFLNNIPREGFVRGEEMCNVIREGRKKVVGNWIGLNAFHRHTQVW